VNAVVVVEGEVGVEFAPEAGVARVEVARERWSSALVEDRLVKRFDVAVGLRSAGVDAAMARAEPLERSVERQPAELVAVVCEHALELPAGGLEL